MSISIKEILKDMYQHCLDMQKMADTKNAGLIAFNGIIIVALFNLISKNELNIFFNCYLVYVVFCSIISVFLNLSAISAQLNFKEHNSSTNENKNLMFFVTVANLTPQDYLKVLIEQYNLNEVTSKYHEDLSKQVVINAQITLRKFKLYNRALKYTIAGIATPISVIIYSCFFENKKL